MEYQQLLKRPIWHEVMVVVVAVATTVHIVIV